MTRKFLVFAALIVAISVISLVLFLPTLAKSDSQWCVGLESGGGVKCDGTFNSIQEAIDDSGVVDGDVIVVGSGNFAGALVDKSVEIRGTDGTVITNGPPHPSGLSQGFRLLTGSSGASLNHMTFTADLAIMAGDPVSNVTVSHNTFLNAIQAISAWRASYWSIDYNTIVDLRTRNGGGIGILLGDYSGLVTGGNEVSHNDISGTVHVCSCDLGGYNGSGIVVYADFRWGRAGAAEISGNLVTHNTVSLVSDTPAVVDVAAFELTEARDPDPEHPVIFDNAIGFNDFSGTNADSQIVLTPEKLDERNDISRNKGDNRGHGAHPSGFK